MRAKDAQSVKQAVFGLMSTVEQALRQNIAFHYEDRLEARPDRVLFLLLELRRALGHPTMRLPSMQSLDRLWQRCAGLLEVCKDPIESSSLRVLGRVFVMLSREASCDVAHLKILRAHGNMLHDYAKYLGPEDWMDRFYRQRISALQEQRELVR